MNLSTLQLFLRGLIGPLTLVNPSSDAVENLRQSCDLLATFGDMSFGQFSELLRQTEEYQKTKTVAVPVSLRPVIDCFERVRFLRDRANVPEPDREGLARDLAAVSLDSLELTDLLRLTADLEIEVTTGRKKPTKPDVIEAIWLRITGWSKPKAKKAASTRPRKPKPAVSLDDIAQQIENLKKSLSSGTVSGDDVERQLNALDLNKLSKSDLIKLGQQLKCNVGSKTSKDDAILAIRRIVLLVQGIGVGEIT